MWFKSTPRGMCRRLLLCCLFFVLLLLIFYHLQELPCYPIICSFVHSSIHPSIHTSTLFNLGRKFLGRGETVACTGRLRDVERLEWLTYRRRPLESYKSNNVFILKKDTPTTRSSHPSGKAVSSSSLSSCSLPISSDDVGRASMISNPWERHVLKWNTFNQTFYYLMAMMTWVSLVWVWSEESLIALDKVVAEMKLKFHHYHDAT